MSGFKRNSSRFANNGGGSSGSSSGSGRSSGGYSRGGSTGGGSRSGGSGKKGKFTSLGSLHVPKSASDDMKALILNELKNSEIKLNAKIFLPKGVDSVTLNRDELLVISFKTFDSDPDFVVGRLLLPNNEE